jgi:hypothetical protein
VQEEVDVDLRLAEHVHHRRALVLHLQQILKNKRNIFLQPNVNLQIILAEN